MEYLNIKVLDEDGNEKPLSDFVLGKWTVLYFYPKDNTPGCTTEAKEFTELIEEFEKLGFQVIGVSCDSPKSHRKFKEKHGLKIRLISDPNAELHKGLGAWGKKKRYGREYEGAIRSTFILSPKGEILWKKIKVKAKGHAKEVLEEAKRLISLENQI
ncbi:MULTISPECIES: peroxiredoxin [Thermococcus]|uniref:thioredoxin-dependent peroxiredoxin n=2 Tax=Thermococcus sibiricus TaxID=172049 RepID=C5ZZU1_THESM|nr:MULTISPECIES: peroxiredoxin [Thermococcus]KUK29141.1 MAG: Peroxiredoxin, bacterioferritin comigratory like protein, AhpC/TSA family [Thermococcus sp. 40_45]HII66960.1 peroxiredoxin [Thermococcaceae archaeon]ACS90922.1 Peroxiredoxin, bacterioferritin comigratory like protein, AhpC/TSA family [Thermococcus sibiricus MM 739]KUK18500.1 MAG: Peroxiredoxin, bacterioferritin comigratory like protein, AhpC/TSA family [Thermococcus sibiricus]MBC7094060.1 peroxiredoxin [Thermococcus sp.]